MQTINGIDVPTNSDEYNLTADLAGMATDANVIRRAASEAARNALPNLTAGVHVYRTDTGRTEVYNGSRWAVPASTERGYSYVTPSTIATTDYASVAGFGIKTLGGKLKLSYTGVFENANSGANRTADVQWLVDGVAFGGVTFNAPLVSGFANPATAVAMEREYDIGPGNHVVELQTRANASGAVRNVLFSLTVRENP